MQLKLIAVYLDSSQLDYILAVKNGFLQENFNFEFEYFDKESDFATLHQIASCPSFCLTKSDRIVSVIEGKIDFSDLKDRLLKINYVRNEQ